MSDNYCQETNLHNRDDRIAVISNHIRRGQKTVLGDVVIDNEVDKKKNDQQRTGQDLNNPKPNVLAGIERGRGSRGEILSHGQDSII
jgi:hypothetical protein